MNPERFAQLLEQLRGVCDTLVPTAYHPPPVPTALGALIVGIGIAVLGARLARGGLTLVFACAGGLTAFALRGSVNWSPAVLLAVGMTAGALLGFVLFRLWIGVAAAAVCSALALGVYGSRNIVPHFVEYDSTHNFNGTFVIPESPLPASDTSAATETAAVQDSLARLRQWWGEFWLYVQSKESDVNRWVLGIACGAALLGFLVGSVLPRLTLVVVTGCLGTSLVIAAFVALARQSNGQLYDAAIGNPRAIGIVSLVLVATSMVLQGLLTRRPRPAAANPVDE